MKRYECYEYESLNWPPKNKNAMRESSEGEYYLASEADAEIARLREAVTGAYDIITRRLAEPEDDSDTGSLVKAATLLDAALSSSPQSCTCGFPEVGHHSSCPLFNQTHSTSSPQSEPTPCVWSQLEWDYDHWACSACGCEWVFEDGGPIENDMAFCPKCGRKIDVFKPYKEFDDDDLPEPPEVK